MIRPNGIEKGNSEVFLDLDNKSSEQYHFDIPSPVKGVILKNSNESDKNGNDLNLSYKNSLKNDADEDNQASTREVVVENTNYPVLHLIVKGKSGEDKESIIITPTSINGVVKKLGEKFFFGRRNLVAKRKVNDYSFDDETLSSKQFEILYKPEENGYFVADFKKGKGLFVRIRHKVLLDKAYIFTFCSVHILVTATEGGPNKNILKVKFINGNCIDREEYFY